MASIVPEQDERAIFCGKTGSGKTRGAIWVLQQILARDSGPVIICDTKIESQFLRMTEPWKIQTISGLAIPKWSGHQRVAIVQPTTLDIAAPGRLDSYLWELHESIRGATIYLDEAYHWHDRGRAGPGLIGLLTRGRSRRQSVLMSVQRPAWASRFCFSEVEHYYVYRLNDKKDRLRTAEFCGPPVMAPPAKYYFWHYAASDDSPEYFRPVPSIEYRTKRVV